LRSLAPPSWIFGEDDVEESPGLPGRGGSSSIGGIGGGAVGPATGAGFGAPVVSAPKKPPAGAGAGGVETGAAGA
jgi:hypothetical protein